jgi:aldose 1-epimerase
MAPWAGSDRGAHVDWDGSSYRLEANDGPHAIHGVVFGRPWRVRGTAAAAAELEIDLGPLGWPFGGVARQTVRLWADGIELTAEITAADVPMPAALGWHPWFRRPTDGDMAVRVEAADTLETAADLIPTGRRLPVGGATDLRTGPPLGERRLDHVYPDVGSPVVVSWPDLTLTMTFSPVVRTFVVHSPPAGVCVEPQTAWPDAIALAARGISGTGLTSVAAGETFRATKRPVVGLATRALIAVTQDSENWAGRDSSRTALREVAPRDPLPDERRRADSSSLVGLAFHPEPEGTTQMTTDPIPQTRDDGIDDHIDRANEMPRHGSTAAPAVAAIPIPRDPAEPRPVPPRQRRPAARLRAAPRCWPPASPRPARTASSSPRAP